MRNNPYFQPRSRFEHQLAALGESIPKKVVVGIVLALALFAFEVFNFDTSQYALRNLLGEVKFLGLQWATILSVAFCAIDFAGLIRIFTPERGADEPKEVWYLTGAWLLGATMNAILTWWAVSVALLNHNFGNEVLSREQLLTYVPIFVAVLVWLTRILFIGAFSVTGEHLVEMYNANQAAQNRSQPAAQAVMSRPIAQQSRVHRPATAVATPTPVRASRPAPKPQPTGPTTTFVEELQYEPILAKPTQPMQAPASAPQPKPSSRVGNRPPRPTTARQPAIHGVQARPRNNRH